MTDVTPQNASRRFRSWLYVPGDRQRMIEKALGLPTDAIMFDLEDGVALSEKPAARRLVSAMLDSFAGAPSGGPARYVRVGVVASAEIAADLDAAVRAGCDGIVLPKVERAEEIVTAASQITALESARGLQPGAMRLLASIESPASLFNAHAIALASRRIVGLIFGAEDYARAMGLPLRREGEAVDLLYARSHIATVAAAVGIQAVDGIWPHLADSEGLKAYATQARRLGLTGMSLLHPNQIDPVNVAFAPTAGDIVYAESVLKAFSEAQQRGSGVSALNGQFLDAPIVERARQILELGKSLKV